MRLLKSPRLTPTKGTPTSTSVLNYQSGIGALANGAIVPVCQPNCTNQLTIATNGAGADLVMDIVGYFRPPGGAMGNVVVNGNLTLAESTATAGNIMKGSNAFIHNFGVQNTFIGENAGNLTMTGFGNTGSGVGALTVNTTGNNNTAIGVVALDNNMTGSNNTAAGAAALLLNTTGNDNTASGVEALALNSTGSFNTATVRLVPSTPPAAPVRSPSTRRAIRTRPVATRHSSTT